MDGIMETIFGECRANDEEREPIDDEEDLSIRDLYNHGCGWDSD